MTSVDTSRILKANSARKLGSKVAFNYEDVQQRLDEHVETARRRAAQLVQDAQSEAEALGQQIQQQAHESGRQEGLANAEAEIERRAQQRAEQIASEKLNASLPAIENLANSLIGERDRWIKEWESAAIRLSVAIAEKVIRRELKAQPRPTIAVVREALELAAGSERIRLLLHPDDLASLGTQTEAIVKQLAKCSEAVCAGDESISRGGCVIETEHGVVDARLETQLERIASELLDSDC